MEKTAILSWIEANSQSENFESALVRLLSFACAQWIGRENGEVLPPERALSMFLGLRSEDASVGKWLENPKEFTAEIAGFCERSKVEPLPQELRRDFPKVLDLRGVVCPNNAARARLFMTGAPEDYVIAMYLDEGSPIENVPSAMIADGYKVLHREKKEGFWSLSVVKPAIKK